MPSSESDAQRSTTFRVDVSSDRASVLPDRQPSFWDEAPTAEQQAMQRMVATALRHMSEHVEEWLPTAGITVSHNRIWLVVSWENGALHDEVLLQGLQAENDRAQRVADLLRMSQTTSE